MYLQFFKPLFDKSIAFLVLLVSLPITIPITILLTIANSGKPFFFQPRPGLEERIFHVVKFKTMNDRKDEKGELLPDKDRLTAIGSFVRKTSLDEIPQLWNVLKGDMSLVGPRPLLVEYLPLYNAQQKKRHAVKPGITGWAQVNGRNSLAWEDKFNLDVHYVEQISFSLDMKILFLTIYKVFKAEGISGEGSVTMEKFKGSN
jgi:undecaprenyl phosphate N,N'-diacetylbacillosamine 1-phosphate transferase